MRDIVISVVVFGLLASLFKHPVIGAHLWAWLSLMNPHKLAWGFARGLPFAQATAGLTMLVLLQTKHKQRLPWNGVTTIWALLFLWMTVTCFFAYNQPQLVLDRWVFVLKIHLMLLVSLMLVVEPRHFKILVYVVTLSVAFFGIKGGVYTISTGGGGRVWGPPGGLLQGNNEMAIGLVMVLPFMYWMRETLAHRWLRRGLGLGMLLCVVSILGTQSRGALLAVIAMGFFLGVKSKHPLRVTLALAVVLLVTAAFMADEWVERMETIQTYQEDSSAMSRIWTWTTLWNAALNNPLTGAGFRADSRLVFSLYAPQGDQWEMFTGRIYVAHSIYFQMLGEHGFVGLFLFLGLWATVWAQAGRIGKQAAKVAELSAWLPLLMRMVQASLVGYAVGGAFLSLAYLDLTFYLMGFVILGGITLSRALTRQPAAPQVAGSTAAKVSQALPASRARGA